MLNALNGVMSTEAEDPQPGRECLLIKNETADGKRFRPSDWAERLQSTLSCLEDDEFKQCIGLVQIVSVDGSKCILVDKSLAEQEPRLYRFLMRFATENNLVTETQQAGADAPDAAQQQAGSFRRAFSF